MKEGLPGIAVARISTPLYRPVVVGPPWHQLLGCSASRSEEGLWQRLLGRPASESGRLRHDEGTHGSGARRRRGLVLPTLRQSIRALGKCIDPKQARG
jgi:hypothetical protein